MLQTLIIFLVFLTPLIFFHELGHFLFARLFGVRVEIFSIGFGPKIFKKKWGDTEYAVSVIPLGGYIKMFGDDPLKADELPEMERQYAFNHKGKWARFWIVFGGPLANFILAYVLFFFLLLGGEKVPEPKIGKMAPDNVLVTKGLKAGDVLVGVNGQEVLGLTDLTLKAEGTRVETVTVQRSDQNFQISIDLPTKDFIENLVRVNGYLRRPVLTDASGKLWGVSGSETFDADQSIEEIHNRNLSTVYLFPIKKENGDYIAEGKGQAFSLSKDLLTDLRGQNYITTDLMVRDVVAGSPAAKVGVQKGDIIHSIDGVITSDFDQVRSLVQKADAGKPIRVSFFREGKLNRVSLIPEVREEGNVKLIGVQSGGDVVPMKFVNSRPKGFFTSIWESFPRTWDAIATTVIGFKKLIVGEASLKNVGGPIAIAKVAGDSFRISFSYFLGLMALVSVNLGVINLFPIPVLDGGHIMFIFLELVNRGPLSRRKMEIAQQVGLSTLLLLIFLALFNDVSRLF